MTSASLSISRTTGSANSPRIAGEGAEVARASPPTSMVRSNAMLATSAVTLDGPESCASARQFSANGRRPSPAGRWEGGGDGGSRFVASLAMASAWAARPEPSALLQLWQLNQYYAREAGA